MERLTVLVGAGGSIELGVPSTNSVTESLLAAVPEEATNAYQHGARDLLRVLHSALAEHYSTPNFEHVLHGLEAITSLERTWRPNIYERFKVISGILCGGPRGELARLFNPRLVTYATALLYDHLHETFDSASQIARTSADWSAYEGFWAKLADTFRLDVVTTNYDSAIEQALTGIEMGFRQIPGELAWRFDPRTLTTSTNRLLHMHGSIHFGYRDIRSPDTFAYEDLWEDLFWYEQPKVARQSWGARSSEPSQAGEENIVGALITGMQKANKLVSADPYASYQRMLGTVVETNPRLLIIGYGFGDFHINGMIARMTRLHGKDRRVAVVTRCPHMEWLTVRRYGHHERTEENRLIQMWSEQRESWPHIMFNADPWTSEKKHCRIYQGGLIHTIKHQLPSLLTFLN